MDTVSVQEKEYGMKQYWPNKSSYLQDYSILGINAFPCNQCGAIFARNCRLKVHMRIHTGEKPYKCKVCGAAFNQGGSLKRHIRIHTGEKPYACHLCDARFSEKGNLTDHIKNHTGEKEYQCPHCDELFTKRSRLQAHIQSHAGQKPFQCVECEASFSERSLLYLHCQTHGGDRPFSCHFCGASFAMQENLEQHMLMHSGENPFKRENSKPALDQNMQENNRVVQDHGMDEKTHKCSVCNAAFGEKENLEKHVALHLSAEEKSQCSEDIKNDASPNARMPALIHTVAEEKPFKCDKCGATFGHSGNLKQHILVHSTEKPKQNQECDEDFVKKDDLLNHSCIKSHNQPFECELCGMTFSQKDSLQDHTKHQHSSPEAKTSDVSTDNNPRTKLKISIDSEFLEKWTTAQPGLAGCRSRWCIPDLQSEIYFGLRSPFMNGAHRFGAMNGVRSSQSVLLSADKFRSKVEATRFDRYRLPGASELPATAAVQKRVRNDERTFEVAKTGKVSNPDLKSCAGVPSFQNAFEKYMAQSLATDTKETPNTKPNSETPSEPAKAKTSDIGSTTEASKISSTLPARYLSAQRRYSAGRRGRRRRGRSFQCKECGATFARQCRLMLHSRIHTGEKPFKCDECGSSFTQMGSLRRHAVVHTRSKPYPCADCDATFTNQGHLQQHCLIHFQHGAESVQHSSASLV